MGGASAPAPPAVAVGAESAVAEPARLLADLIAERVLRTPDGVVRAYSRPGGAHRAQSYAELWERSGQIAALLHHSQLRHGHPVVILADDIIDFLPAFWACLRAGVIAVPLMSAAREAMHHDHSALDAALARLDRPCILADSTFEPLARTLCSGRPCIFLSLTSRAPGLWTINEPAAEPACLVPTSGSTGRLKLVALSGSAIAHRYMTKPPSAAAKTFLGTFPLDSVTGLRAAYLEHESWTQISPALLTTKARALLDAIEECGISTLALTNSIARAVLAGEANERNVRRQLGSLRRVAFGAEPVSRAVLQEFASLIERHGAPADILMVGYGTTETGPLVTGANPFLTSDTGPVSLGCAAPNVTLRIAGENEQILSDGEIGEVQVFAPLRIFSGYWGEPELSRSCFTPDGWWKSGDLGCLRDGELVLHGRSKDVFIAHGRKFSLVDIDAELGSVLGAHDRAYSCTLRLPGAASEKLAVALATAEQDQGYQRQMAGSLRRAVARRFGLRAEPVIALDHGAIPVTATGKIRRAQLSELILSQVSSQEQRPHEQTSVPTEAMLEAIWREALALPDGVIERDADFFDLGGDSLRSLTLYTQILDVFGADISAEEFFAEPTFANLLRLVEHHAHRLRRDEAKPEAAPWPLAPKLRSPLLAAIETWSGERHTRERMVVGLNTTGTKAPIFWVFNANAEPERLAAALGRDQPLYAFRSGHAISAYSEDEIQAFALRYVSEIAEACPDGPVFIGGNCQGGIIALAIAQHALRRGRHVPLLILLNWSFQLHAYGGRVLFVSGRDDVRHNAYKLFSRPELAWRRAFPEFQFVEVPGAHGQAFDDGNVQALSSVLKDHMQAALLAPPNLMPRSAYARTIEVDSPPEVMRAGEIREIDVVVRNTSPVAWDCGVRSGLMLGNRWIDATGAIVAYVDGRSALPELEPGQAALVRLTITAPEAVGKRLQLCIDLVEEGNVWFDARGLNSFNCVVTISGTT